MREFIIALLLACIILIIFYYTETGRELSYKCNNTSSLIVDSVSDIFTEPEQIYQETRGDFYNLKAKTSLKKSLAIPEEKRTASDNYRIGNIYRYYVKNPALTRHYYNIALHQIRDRPNDGTMHMIDRMEDFGDLDVDIPMIKEMIAEDNIVRRIHQFGDVVQQFRPIIDNTDGAPPDNKPRVYGFQQPIQLTEKIVGEANKDKYFQSLATWTKEPQNVHDSNITSDVAKSYQLMMEGIPETNKSIPEIFAEIKRAINDSDASKTTKAKANKVVEAMNSDMIYSKIGVPERVILANVWRRINIPQNKDNKKELVSSFVENLASGIERDNTANKPVCMGGRVSRSISSLARYDHNPEVGVLKTKEIVRNEVFEAAHNEYKTYMEKTITDADENKKKGALDSKNGENTPESEAFENDVKVRIEERLKKQYSDLVDEKDLNILIKEAQAAF